MPRIGPTLRTAALVVDWCAAAIWGVRTIIWLRKIRRVPDLHDPRYATGPTAGKLSVVVPGRNEEAAVEQCLRSLVNSADLALEVIAVDDRSTDGTGAIMDRVQSDVHRPGVSMQVLHIEKLPAGWMGKTHAMDCAAAVATGDWLLFTDADILFRQDALGRALRFVEDEGADHLVLLPTLVCGSFGERMMMAFIYAVSIWGPSLWKIPERRAKKHSIGIGAFNMVRRSAYDAVGGWASLRMEVIEDVRLGHVLKQGGFAQRVAYGRDLLRIRWAESAMGIVRNLTKNAFAVFRFRLPLAIGASFGLLLFYVLPFAAIFAGPAFWIPSGIVFSALACLYWRYSRAADANVAYVVTFPVAACLFLLTLLRSSAYTLAQGGVVWRGTHYSLAELRRNAGPLR